MANQRDNKEREIGKNREEQNPSPKSPQKEQSPKIDRRSEEEDERDTEKRMY